jgi:hypothetical protein
MKKKELKKARGPYRCPSSVMPCITEKGERDTPESRRDTKSMRLYSSLSLSSSLSHGPLNRCNVCRSRFLVHTNNIERMQTRMKRREGEKKNSFHSFFFFCWCVLLSLILYELLLVGWSFYLDSLWFARRRTTSFIHFIHPPGGWWLLPILLLYCLPQKLYYMGDNCT